MGLVSQRVKLRQVELAVAMGNVTQTCEVPFGEAMGKADRW